ncbi:MAG: hypothetical protein ACOY5F_12120 [Pseudomonadota bacterium]|jgi:hypothetical protein
MRKLICAIAAAAAILSFGSLMSDRAEAMPLSAPAAMADVVGSQAEAVAYVCRRVCGRYGCARRCWYTAPRYYRPYYRPYRPYRYYRYRYY